MKTVLVILIAIILVVAGFEDGDLPHIHVSATSHGGKYQTSNPDLNIYNENQDKATSYSISYTDYLYLQRHKTEGRDSPYNPERAPEDEIHHDRGVFPSSGLW